MLKAFARRGLRRLGLDRIRHPSFADLLRHENVQTVFDVGANDGHYGAELREHGYRGRIVSFEPIEAVYRRLQARAKSDPLWSTYRLGVGERNGELTISVSEASVFSSFKPPSEYTAGKFVGAREERKEVVPVTRLDAFLDEHPQYRDRPFLKVDTQGFEKEVLVGAGEWLSAFHGLQLELALKPLYEGQETMVEMIAWLDVHGFELAMAKENGFDWDAVRLLELDTIFTPRGSDRPR